jgi:hypothetical protein
MLDHSAKDKKHISATKITTTAATESNLAIKQCDKGDNQA